MTIGKVIRVMEEKHLFDVPDAREEFEKHGYHGNYFFFVIEDYPEHVVGYLIAKAEENKVLITTVQFSEKLENEEDYKNTAFSNLSEYVSNIRNGKGGFKQVAYA